MKKLLPWIALLLPIVVFSAPQSYRMTWDTLPNDQIVKGECQINGGTFNSVGEGPGNGNINFSLSVNPGDTINCRAKTTKTGFTDSPLSEVAVIVVPLAAPTNVRVVQP